MDVIGILLLLWALPIFVTYQMGVARNRTGWTWGLFLGWLGVAIVACLGYMPSESERELREFEAERQLRELRGLPAAVPEAKPDWLGGKYLR